MLAEMEEIFRGLRRVSILSVGSGVGLFEIPMLKMLQDDDVPISHFVGVDVSSHACARLEENLEAEFGPGIWHEVVCSPFQDFTSSRVFDIVLYNHTFEYLGGRPGRWLCKSESLLASGGRVIVFSPDRGGINLIYGEVARELGGWSPLFADDIDATLANLGNLFQKRTLVAECDVSLLDRSGPHPDKIRLLSFLTQRDCRAIPAETLESYVEYYLSLRQGGPTIPHPTTMFVLQDWALTDAAGLEG
jgi:SAM-dependent methyltransferase